MYSSIFDLAANGQTVRESSTSNTDLVALNSLFDICQVDAACSQPPALSSKYSAPSAQTVVSITNRATLEQTWYNKARTAKPQTFTSTDSGGGALLDPTSGGRTCDFCDWPNLTARDVFGRVENRTCVSASNLFKYCAPFHGLILFKRHHPLEFGGAEIADMLRCAMEWFRRAETAWKGSQLHPFLLWNCLHRAGASQFHGHAQVLSSHAPVPEVEKLRDAQQRWPTFYKDMVKAHRAAGLLCGCGSAGDVAVAFPHLASRKDMEIMIYADDLESKALATMLHAALRTVIDDFGAFSFNVGVLNIKLPDNTHTPSNKFRSMASWMTNELGEFAPAPVVVRVVSRGKLDSKASDFGGLEVFGGASIGHTDPFSIFPRLCARLGSDEVATDLIVL